MCYIGHLDAGGRLTCTVTGAAVGHLETKLGFQMLPAYHTLSGTRSVGPAPKVDELELQLSDLFPENCVPSSPDMIFLKYCDQPSGPSGGGGRGGGLGGPGPPFLGEIWYFLSFS